jgi:hypothetical protein
MCCEPQRNRLAARVAGGVPVSTIDDEYTRSTLELAGKLETYFVIVSGRMW